MPVFYLTQALSLSLSLSLGIYMLRSLWFGHLANAEPVKNGLLRNNTPETL
jgi:hypothetical protein